MGDTDRQAFQKRQIYLQDGARGANSNRRAIQTVFALLFAVTGFVLAIACANVANILLAQVAARAERCRFGCHSVPAGTESSACC